MTGTSFQTANRIQVSDDNIWHYLTPTEKEKYFVFYGEVGKTYIFRTSSDSDLMAYLYDDSFTQIAMDDDSGGNYNPLLSFTATNTTEKYYIKVKGYNDPTETVNFYLTLKEGTLDVDPEDPYEDTVVIRCTAIPVYGYGRSTTSG